MPLISDNPVGIHQHHIGNARDADADAELRLRIEQGGKSWLRLVHVRDLRFGFGGHADHRQLVGELLLETSQCWKVFATRNTPRCPKHHQHNLAVDRGLGKGSGQQRFEARLLKVTVASEGFRDAFILHHDKGNAVGE